MQKRLNTLEVGLNNEMRERDFYLMHAEKTTNPLSKAMFEQIASEEAEHYERLLQIHERWSREEKWPETVPLKVRNTAVKNVLKDVLAATAALPAGNMSDLEAVRTALEFEEKGVIYYAKLRDDVSDPAEKAFFAMLSGIEHEHYASLKDTEEFLVDPSSWYRKHESSRLDGA
jgi:rubrerythrin